MKTAPNEPKVLDYSLILEYLDWCERNELRATTKGYILYLEEVEGMDVDVSE